MEKKSNIFLTAGCIYIVLPIIIFLIGNCNVQTAAIGSILTVICAYLTCRNLPDIWIPQNRKEWLLMGAAFLIILLWVYYSGIGALSFQTPDHIARNAVFELLVSEKWPVIQDGYILTYYTGFWMPASVIGKLTGSLTAGYIVQIFWAAAGVFLTMYYVTAVFKKKLLLPLLIFIFFSGLDIVEAVILDLFRGIPPMENSLLLVKHIEGFFPGAQFSSFTTQLFWVFNQAVPAWVIVMFLYHQKNNKNMIFIYSCMFLCASLPAIGFLPIVLYWSIKNGAETAKEFFTKTHILNIFKNGFSFQNLFGLLFLTPVSYFYLSNNTAVVQGALGGEMVLYHPNYFIVWFFLFFMFEAGIYFLMVFPKYKKDPLFYIILLSLLLYPFHRIGGSIDFCMRATIPALLILYLYVTSMFYEEKPKKPVLWILSAALLIGSMTAWHEIIRSVYYTALGYTKIESKMDTGSGNFFGPAENSRFLKYFGRKN